LFLRYQSVGLSGRTEAAAFLGTGTTAVVAMKMNRYYIGSEISEKYINIARKRIESNDQTLLDLDD
jgi:hypothetical protein